MIGATLATRGLPGWTRSLGSGNPATRAALTGGAVSPAVAPSADSTAPAPASPTPAVGAPAVTVAVAVTDSAATDTARARLRADSALLRRVRLTSGTPDADSFLAGVARARRRSCDAAFAQGRWAEARSTCSAVARLGRGGAARVLGALAERDGDVAEAVKQYESVAARDPAAALRLAQLLASGRGGSAASAGRVTALLRTAADSGLAPAQRALAERYAAGASDTPRDDAAASLWYGRAAGAGDLPAMVLIGERYRDGRGVKRDDAQAATWWRRAAERGDSAAQYRLGMAYLKGKGVPKSDEVALEWLRKAAAQGHPGGRYEVEKRAKSR